MKPRKFSLLLIGHYLVASLIGLTVALFLTSCTQQNDPFNEDPVAKIEFKFNGELKQYTDISAGSARTAGVKYYTFVGLKAQADNMFNITMLTDSLKPGTYNVSTGVVSFHEGTTVATNVSPEFYVTISSNVNGLVNGTFQGSLYNHTTSSAASCIEGKIENVQLVYK